MKIIVAIDGTKNSDGIIDFLKISGLKGRLEFRVISVIDMAVDSSIDIYANSFSTASEIENAVIENALKTLETTSNRIENMFENKNVSINKELLYGSPVSRIVEKAEATKADLVIVGSHGYNRWETLLHRSVSDAILHHSPCSVLVVRNQ